MNGALEDGWLTVLTGDDPTEGRQTAGLRRQEKPQPDVKGRADETDERQDDEREPDERDRDAESFRQGNRHAGDLTSGVIAVSIGCGRARERAVAVGADACLGPYGLSAVRAVFSIVFSHLAR